MFLQYFLCKYALRVCHCHMDRHLYTQYETGYRYRQSRLMKIPYSLLISSLAREVSTGCTFESKAGSHHLPFTPVVKVVWTTEYKFPSVETQVLTELEHRKTGLQLPGHSILHLCELTELASCLRCRKHVVHTIRKNKSRQCFVIEMKWEFRQ